MKKIGLLALALVLALGALGVGYAMWTDTVTVNGTINTGSIDLAIKDIGVTDPGPDPQCGDGVNDEDKDVASVLSENIEPASCAGYYNSVIETFSHVYPWYKGGFIIELTNCGTVRGLLSTLRKRHFD
jgi:predicted ribosomally synthesized peptide with SipW-like signal peptide